VNYGAIRSVCRVGFDKVRADADQRADVGGTVTSPATALSLPKIALNDPVADMINFGPRHAAQ